MDANDPHRYDDMLDLPHPVSAAHPHMTRADRAAQFAPFAALHFQPEATGEENTDFIRQYETPPFLAEDGDEE